MVLLRKIATSFILSIMGLSKKGASFSLRLLRRRCRQLVGPVTGHYARRNMPHKMRKAGGPIGRKCGAENKTSLRNALVRRQ